MIKVKVFEYWEKFPQEVSEYLKKRFPCSLLVLGDVTPELRKHTKLYICFERQRVVGAASQFHGFKEVIAAIVSDNTEVMTILLEHSCKYNNAALVALNALEPLPSTLNSTEFDCDLWMTRKTAPFSFAYHVSHIKENAEIIDFYNKLEMNYWTVSMLEFGHHYGIRVDGSQLVSISGVNFVLAEQDYAQIGSVATLPEWRRKGFSSLCIQATINSLFQAGIGKCGLFVEKSNPYLIDFYRKLGFQPAGSFYFFYYR